MLVAPCLPVHIVIHSHTSQYEMCENVLMAKQAALSFRIPDEMKEALDRAAAADDRSVSSLVTIILRDWLREKGHLAE